MTLIPSEFFTNKYTFSDGSHNIYEATDEFSRHLQDLLDSKNDLDKDSNLSESKCQDIAKELFSFCCKNPEISKTVISLIANQDSIIRTNVNRIWEQFMGLVEEPLSKPTVYEIDFVSQIEKITNTSKLSPLPVDLKINPNLNDIILKYLTSNDEASYEKALELFSNYSPQEILLTVKYVEHVGIERKQQQKMQRSSYELRTLCAAKSRGTITTAEAYTYSLDSSLYHERKRLALYLQDETHYLPERQRDHYMVLLRSELEMMNMSRRYNDQTPTIYAVRGNTAAGKSYACKNDIQFKRGLLNGEAIGSLNPDTVKTDLRRGVPGITDEQIHFEGAILAEKLTNELKKKAIKSSLVLDERLAEKSKILELTSIADLKHSDLKLLDLENPLQVSCCRVLRRNLSKEPCVPFMPISNGYIAIRKNREEIIKEVQSNPKINQYKLVVNMPDGSSGVAATKIDGEFKIVNQAFFDEALKTPSNDEANAIGNRVINDELIQEMKQIYTHESWDHLSQFKGKTIKDAIDARAFETP